VDPIEQAHLLQFLRKRRDAIAAQWYAAVAPTGFVSFTAAEVREYLTKLTDQILALWLAEPFEREEGQAVGFRLAHLHYVQAETLGRTLDVLAHQLMDGLTVDQVAALRPRLVALLSELATGFSRQVRAIILEEQEQIRGALLMERCRMEQALRESEGRFRTTFEDAAIGVALIDLEGRILDSNPALSRMIGYGVDEIRGVMFTTIVHPDDLRVNINSYNELVEGKRDHYHMESRYIRKDGQILWARVAVSRIQEGQNTSPFTIKMVEDITAQKQVESELAEAQRRLMNSREAERLRLAQELHDNPLQELHGVRLLLKALASDVQNPAVLAQLEAAQETLHQATKTLRFMSMDLRPPTLVPFGVQGAIRSHIAHFQAAHPEVMVQAALASDGHTLSEQVRLALFRIYQEVLNNLVQHAAARSVTIRFEVDAEQVLLEVRDDGRGFTPPVRWSTLAPQGHLGLLGATERAEAIGGRLEVASAPGQGTMVRVVVPRLGHVDV